MRSVYHGFGGRSRGDSKVSSNDEREDSIDPMIPACGEASMMLRGEYRGGFVVEELLGWMAGGQSESLGHRAREREKSRRGYYSTESSLHTSWPSG